ncbi:hypothetical protein GGR57DRAFT_132983 [Xylariaceae sp. FL1272]|nr:hypothetical protein GGR57DRAFT_132983 [Xylariaceae sp. FL1272]
MPEKMSKARFYLTPLRAQIQEQFWFHMPKTERQELRETFPPKGDETYTRNLQAIKEKWPERWNMGPCGPYHFRQYLTDQTAATQAWTLIEEDIFLVIDSKHQMIFANIENLAGILYGDGVLDPMYRAIDMWFH